MTDQLLNKLKDRHKEELEDRTKYLELASELEKDGAGKAAGIIRDIADEEEIHAQLLEHVLNWNK